MLAQEEGLLYTALSVRHSVSTRRPFMDERGCPGKGFKPASLPLPDSLGQHLFGISFGG